MTTKRLEFSKLARKDVRTAIRYYVQQGGEGLALSFTAELETTYGRVASAPLAGSPRYSESLGLRGLRSMKLRKFPYLIFYLDRPDAVDVLRVLHQARNIPHWLAESEG